MKRCPDPSVLRGLLFLFDIDNTDDRERVKTIASKNINDDNELVELFALLMKPEFMSYSDSDRQLYIDTISRCLDEGESFDSVFAMLTTYFDDEVKDYRSFMRVLLGCLVRYRLKGTDLFS